MKLMTINTAPRDRDILVFYDHDADPYYDPNDPTRLTEYASWAESGDFLDGKGWAIAKWQPQWFESTDQYGGGYWMLAAWFSRGDFCDYETVCNPIGWCDLPDEVVVKDE